MSLALEKIFFSKLAKQIDNYEIYYILRKTIYFESVEILYSIKILYFIFTFSCRVDPMEILV